jgi:hypothetical protein
VLDELRVKKLDLDSRISDVTFSQYNAELVRKSLLDFASVFSHPTPAEQAEALRCIVKDVTLHKDTLVLNIFELEEFKPPDSQNRTNWLPI